jgi:hypothetical protein
VYSSRACETVPRTGEVARFPVETLGTHNNGNTEHNATSTGAPQQSMYMHMVDDSTAVLRLVLQIFCCSSAAVVDRCQCEMAFLQHSKQLLSTCFLDATGGDRKLRSAVYGTQPSCQDDPCKRFLSS